MNHPQTHANCYIETISSYYHNKYYAIANYGCNNEHFIKTFKLNISYWLIIDEAKA